MKVLLVGGGGREHALAWKLAQSPRLTRLYAAPGNPGIAAHADCVPVRDTDLDELVALARRERVELAVIGPEVPLSLGLRDRLSDAGVPVFGPSQSAARLESSKAFAKDLMALYGIPTARFRVFQDADAAKRFCRELGAPLVIKADGLAAGKGAMVCATLPEADAAIRLCLDEDAFGAAGRTVVVEEFMTGEEASFFVITDGASALPLPAAQDHKAIFDDDRGPNTGGMGAYTPAPVMDEAMTGRVMEEIVTPTLAAMAKEGAPYAGVLFVGLMIGPDGPRVVEFNCRFGDPECQAILPRLDEDILPVFEAVASGRGLPASLRWRREASVCVVLASPGYPGTPRAGLPIEGVEAAAALPGVNVFHAGTALRDGALLTAGGRVLGVQTLGGDIRAAIERAYDAVGRIRFEGMQFRHDIGRRALARS
ncbi:MAG: phosphoribosylamine--glycine ligase [Candidatus Rokuibacteriota bacterium]|nr:MAG: phosphoribosylamine--glycine ligase [Candidatus Rokubacteria bacterium]